MEKPEKSTILTDTFWARIDRQLAETPRNEATLQQMMAAGVQAYQKAEYEPATRSFAAAGRLATNLRDPEHPDTLTTMDSLATTLLARGDLAGAEGQQRTVLESRRRVLGAEHPDTLTSMNNLAATLLARGDLAGAEGQQRTVLESRRRVLGAEHPETLTSMNNLALTLMTRGDLAGAEGQQRTVLELRRRLQGTEHVATLIAMNNLAETLRARGDLAGAEEQQRTVLESRRRVLGAEHPDTLTSMNNLSGTLKARGDLAGAEGVQRTVLESRRRVLGAEHPDTLTSMSNLALTLMARGDLAGAEGQQRTVLESRRRLLGAKHPDTLTSMNNLALTLMARGDLAGAEEQQRTVLEALRHVLGSEHPDTLTSMGNLALTLKARGDPAGAEEQQRTVLKARHRLLGAEHPNTLTARGNLAVTLKARGDLASAEEQQRTVLEALRHVLGAEHPDTLTAMGNLARTLKARGDLAGAEDLLAESLDGVEHLRGQVGGVLERARLSGAFHTDVISVVLAGVLVRRKKTSVDVVEALERGSGRTTLDVLSRGGLDPLILAQNRLDQSDLLAYGNALRDVRRFERSVAEFKFKFRTVPDSEQDRKRLSDDLAQARSDLREAGGRCFGFERKVFSAAQPLGLERIRGALCAGERLVVFGWSWVAAVAAVVSEDAHGATDTTHLLSEDRDELARGEALTQLVTMGIEPESHQAPRLEAALAQVESLLTADALADCRDRVARLRANYDAVFGRGPEAKLLAVPTLPWETLGVLARALLDIILPADLRAELAKAQRLDVVPSGPLQRLPLELLVEMAGVAELAGKPITYVPSGTVLALQRAKARTGADTSGATLAGDPAYPQPGDGGAERSLAEVAPWNLGYSGGVVAPLPRTRDEVEDIAGLFERCGHKARTLLGAEATVAAVREHTAGKRYLHLAAHGLLAGSDQPMDSAVVLAPAAPSGRPEGRVGRNDGCLRLSDLLGDWGDRLAGCELVTLSACRTSRGVAVGGSLMALPLGLFHAGARCVLASLWKVPDLATWLLMRRFYENLLGIAHGDETAVSRDVVALPMHGALREAQQWLRELSRDNIMGILADAGAQDEYSNVPKDAFVHPAHWAAFVLIGDAG